MDHCKNCTHTDNHKSCVSLVPIFNHLKDSQMNEIMKVTKAVTYKKGEIVFRAGDQSDSLYIISRGKIKIYRLSESGKEQLLHILASGDFTGELALFSESIHESYGEAMINTDICMIVRSDLQKYLLKYPSISLKILSELSRRLENIEKQTTRFATDTVETRIALFLIETVENNNQKMEFTLPMSKKDLASYLGTTPETVSRKLAALEDEKYIQQLPHRKIKILDFERLLEI